MRPWLDRERVQVRGGFLEWTVRHAARNTHAPAGASFGTARRVAAPRMCFAPPRGQALDQFGIFRLYVAHPRLRFTSPVIMLSSSLNRSGMSRYGLDMIPYRFISPMVCSAAIRTLVISAL